MTEDEVFDNNDELIVIPWTTAVKMYPFRRNYLAFFVEAMDEDQIPQAESQIVRILRQRHVRVSVQRELVIDRRRQHRCCWIPRALILYY